MMTRDCAHPAERGYKCNICQGEFDTLEALREHQKQGHLR